MSMKMLVFVKGKSKPALFENVADWTVLSGALVVHFEDESVCILADGRWNEADVQVVKPEVKNDESI